MYNPFKWHIIKYRNRYIVRKLTLKGFVYMDKVDGDHYPTLKECWEWGGFNTMPDAQMLLFSLKVERV